MNSNGSDSPETLNSAQNQLYLSRVTLKFHGWPWKTIGHLFYATSRFEHHFMAICEFELELQSEKSQFWVKIDFFLPCDLEIWRITLTNNREPLLCYFNLYASFHSHLWIQTGDTVWKRTNWVEIDDFLSVWPWNLTDDLEINRAPLLNNIKSCASFHHYMWNQTGVMVPKQLIWVLTSVTLTFVLWLWTFV